MYFYHNTPKPTEILKRQKIKLRKFDYSKYLSYVISYTSADDIVAGNLPTSYPKCRCQIPYMGNGIYCFEKKIDASNYQNGSVITIICKDDIAIINLDDPRTLYETYMILKREGNKYIEDMTDPESKKKWNLLLELIISSFQKRFESNSTIIIGVFMFFWQKIMKKKLSDVYKKEFHDILNPDLGPYCLINTTTKILKYC